MNYKQLALTITGCLFSALLSASQASSTSMSSTSSAKSTSSPSSSSSSSSSSATMRTTIAPRQQATAQNTLGGVSLNTQVLDKIIDRLSQKLAPTLKKELKATATEILAEAKRTGNEVFVRGGEILLNSGERLIVIVVIVGTVVYLLTYQPVLAVVLITSFLSAPAMYLHSRGELKPLLLDVINAYGNTVRLQHTLETTTQTLDATNRTLAETRANLEATRITLAEATAKLNASH